MANLPSTFKTRVQEAVKEPSDVGLEKDWWWVLLHARRMTSTKQNATQCEPASELAEQPAHRAVQSERRPPFKESKFDIGIIYYV